MSLCVTSGELQFSHNFYRKVASLNTEKLKKVDLNCFATFFMELIDLKLLANF